MFNLPDGYRSWSEFAFEAALIAVFFGAGIAALAFASMLDAMPPV